MIVCPVCEHPQASGSECEVCGRLLVEGRATDALVTPVEGLEVTRFESAVEAPVERVPELEPTMQGATGAPLAELVPDLEPTATGPVEATLDPVPDLERIGDGIQVDAPSPLPMVIVCRYCRTEAGPGERVCGRCGMRLPVFAPAPAPGEAAPTRFCSCGTPITRSLCPACGARNATP